MWAAITGKCDVVASLISLGADVDIQTNVSHFLCLLMTLANLKSTKFHALCTTSLNAFTSIIPMSYFIY